MKRNRFSKALKQLKSTELDEKLKRLEEAAPTNSIGGVYSLNPPGFRLGEKDPERVFYADVDGNWPEGIPGVDGELSYTRPAGYWDYGPGTVPAVQTTTPRDWSLDTVGEDGNSTNTMIRDSDGLVLADLPDGTRNFILGPLVDGYVLNHGSVYNDDYTNIGYIQKDTRQFILLGRIQGAWTSAQKITVGGYTSRVWNGESSQFTSYNPNFTLEHALWFRDQMISGNYGDAAYKYSGGVPQQPHPDDPEFKRGNGAGNGGNGGKGGAGGSGDDEGEDQDDPRKGGPKDAGFPWDLYKKLKDWLFGDDKKKKKKKPEEKYGPAFGDDKKANKERDNLIKKLEKDLSKYRDDPKVKKAVKDWNDALYKAGGGDAAREKKGQTRDDVIEQGRKNLGFPPTPKPKPSGAASGPTGGESGEFGPGRQRGFRLPGLGADSKPSTSNAELQRLMSKPPGTHTPAEKQKLLDAGLDDFVKGGQTASPLSDLIGFTLAGLSGVAAAAIGLVGLSKLGLVASGVGIANQAKETLVDKANDSGQYNKQLGGKLVTSIISGQPQEIELTPAAKQDQINNVDKEQFAQALQFGPAPKPSAKSTVNPTQKRPVLTGGWGAQGGSEVHYDPKTDTLTITSEKMLRIGQPGDEFERPAQPTFNPTMTSGSDGKRGFKIPTLDTTGTQNNQDRGKQTKFGDIPSPSQAKVEGITRNLLDNVPGVDQFMGGMGNIMSPITSGQNMWDYLKNNPEAKKQFIQNVSKQANDLATGAVQGTASNVVELRKALTNLGFPQSEVEKMGGGYGQVYSQTSYKGNEIPKEIRDIIDKKNGVKESFNLTESRKRILREIKQPYKLPEQPKQKYKMNFKGKFSPQNTPDVTASKKTDEEVKAQNAAGQTWRTKDKYWSRYQSQERMNIIYDQVGHGDQYWNMIVNENQNKKGTRDRQIQEYLNIIAHEKAMLQENPNYVSPFSQKIQEQETLQADSDPLFKKVSNRLKKEIDYPNKPSKAGYPNDPPPKMVNGFHPDFGERDSYYNSLDPQSAEAMPKTDNPKIDAKVEKAKRIKKIIGKKG